MRLARFMGDRGFTSNRSACQRTRGYVNRLQERGIAIILVTCLLAGCGKPKPAPQTVNAPVGFSGAIMEMHVNGAGSSYSATASQLTDAQKIDLLRKEAHKRGLKWKVFCTSGPAWKFQGWAVQPGDNFKTSIEDGEKDSWWSRGDSQAEAAYKLYLSIQGLPNMPAQHAQKAERENCPPELRGE